MTEKQKAQEIVEKYHIKPIDFFYKDENGNASIEIGTMTWKSAKECAKIHVRGIINILSIDFTSLQKEKLLFWNEVLKEIDNI